MKEAIIRSITGIIFVALVILSLVLHPFAYLILFSIFIALALFELSGMFPDLLSLRNKIIFSFLLTGNFVLLYFIAAGYISNTWILIPAGLILVIIVFQVLPGYREKGSGNSFIMTGMIYLLLGFSSMHFLAFSTGTEATYTPRWILITLGFLWMNDTMAYVSGRLTGKHSIWPSVSPGKTWEGSIGGAGFTVGLAIVFSRYFPELSAWEWISFACIVIVFGSLGDFLESWVKRKANVKDSGSILPGHGGILDRFDSLILALPFVAIYLNFIL